MISQCLLLAVVVAVDDPPLRRSPPPVEANAGKMDDAPRSVEQQLKLARWCRDRGHLAAMRDRLQRILAVDPDHEAALAMLAETPAALLSPMTREDALALKRRVEAEFRRLLSPVGKTRRAALAVLTRLAETHQAPAIQEHAERLLAQVEALRSTKPRVVLEFRGTTSSLQGLRSQPVSLGVGSPVSLQLPELKTVRVGTTVVAPGG